MFFRYCEVFPRVSLTLKILLLLTVLLLSVSSPLLRKVNATSSTRRLQRFRIAGVESTRKSIALGFKIIEKDLKFEEMRKAE